MIRLGYMAKRVRTLSEWPGLEDVDSVYSVSRCISADFAEYVGYWKHNGFWFFDSPAVIQELAREEGLDLEGTKLFYYEAHHLQFDGDSKRWQGFGPEPSLATSVVVPANKALEGYDVVTFSAGAAAECSPLSCNGLASRVKVDRHCLLSSLEEALALVETDVFDAAEPGPYRVVAVYSTKG